MVVNGRHAPSQILNFCLDMEYLLRKLLVILVSAPLSGSLGVALESTTRRNFILTMLHLTSWCLALDF